MDRIRIVGGSKLNGTIAISGAKNAALPLMIAALLTEETLILDNVPRLADVAQLQRILGNHGVDIMSAGKRPGDGQYQGQTLHISAADIIDTTAPYDLVSRMRASFWVIAPLLARMHEAKVSLPGGCAIGTRPVDLLIMALEKLGADLTIDAGYVVAKAPGGLRGATIDFPKVTVSGTHVALMAATLAKGTTVINNAACEPEIADGAGCLRRRRFPDHRDDLREPLHACAGTGAVRRADFAQWRDRHHRRHRKAARRARHGDRSARVGVAGDRGPCRRRRNHGQPDL